MGRSLMHIVGVTERPRPGALGGMVATSPASWAASGVQRRDLLALKVKPGTEPRPSCRVPAIIHAVITGGRRAHLGEGGPVPSRSCPSG